MVDNTIALHKFLCDESSDGNHGQAAISDLLGLHLQLTLLVLGVHAEWVKVQVSWEVFGIFTVGAIDLINVNDRSSTQDDGPVPWTDLVQASVQDIGVAVGGIDDGRCVNGVGQGTVPQFSQWPSGSGL